MMLWNGTNIYKTRVFASLDEWTGSAEARVFISKIQMDTWVKSGQGASGRIMILKNENMMPAEIYLLKVDLKNDIVNSSCEKT